MTNFRVKEACLLLGVLFVGCFSLEIPKNGEKSSDCDKEQCVADPKSSPTVVTNPTVKPTKPGYADYGDDDDTSYKAPTPANEKKKLSEREVKMAHERLLAQIDKNENPDEPEKHVLERWGFFDTPTLGELDGKRDTEYSKGIGAFEEMIKDDKKLTKRQKEEINAELENFLEDDHNYQMWSAYVYKQEKNKRKKRGIAEHEIYSYHDMPNPYYQKNQ